MSGARHRAERFGRWAEFLCVARLRLAGYRVLARRLRTPLGEIVWRHDRDAPKRTQVLPRTAVEDMNTMLFSAVENGGNALVTVTRSGGTAPRHVRRRRARQDDRRCRPRC